MSAVLVAVFLGFGALLGAAGGDSGRLLAASGTPLKLVVPRTPAASTPSGGREAAEAEPPAAEPELEPAPATTASRSSPRSARPGSEAEAEGAAKGGSAAPAKLSEIGHVFVILLSSQPYAATFGPETSDTYIGRTLERKGALLVHYDAVAHEGLANGIALLSGQGPTPATAADCTTYSPFSATGIGADAQLLGEGCVYPRTVETLPGQLAAHHLRWRAYVEGTDEAGAAAGACAHPEPGAVDPTATGGPYATYRNAPVYFESLTADPSCATSDVGLAALKGDLAGAASGTPAFSLIVPDRCHDGGPTACSAGAPTGPATASSWLSSVVGEIMASKAFRKDGLIAITTDQAPSSGELADSSACCGQPPYPNFTAPELGKGGGAVGALLLSPFIKGGATSQEPYNHYSLLRTIEDVFGLSHLGYAALPGVKPLPASLLNAPRKG